MCFAIGELCDGRRQDDGVKGDTGLTRRDRVLTRRVAWCHVGFVGTAAMRLTAFRALLTTCTPPAPLPASVGNGATRI